MIVYHLPIPNYVFTTYRLIYCCIFFSSVSALVRWTLILFTSFRRSFHFRSLRLFALFICCDLELCAACHSSVWCVCACICLYEIFFSVAGVLVARLRNAHAFTGHKHDCRPWPVHCDFGLNMNVLVANGCQLIFPERIPQKGIIITEIGLLLHIACNVTLHQNHGKNFRTKIRN